MQVQSSCCAHKTDCFLTLLLSSSCVVRRASCVVRRASCVVRRASSLLKFPNIPARRGWKLDGWPGANIPSWGLLLLSLIFCLFLFSLSYLTTKCGLESICIAILRSADEKREKKEYSTRIEVGFNGRSIRAELFRRREKSRGNRGFVSV